MRRVSHRFAAAALLIWVGLVVAGFMLGEKRVSSDGDPTFERNRLLQQLEHAREENRLLRAQLGTRELLEDEIAGGFHLLAAQLTPFPDLSPHRRSVMIDVGSAEGVAVGQGVVSEVGIVGRIAEVSAHHSRVTLADDAEFHVRFSTVDESERGGMARGTGSPKKLLTIHQEKAFHVFAVGEQLITAGGDGVFPRGIVIGRLEEVVAVRANATIALPHDLLTLSTVQVLLPPHTAWKKEKR